MKCSINAEVHPRARVGEGTAVWHYSRIREDAVIGRGCLIGQGVYIDCGVIIGDNCKIGNGVSVYRGVRIDNEVFIAPHVTFTNVRMPRAFINRKACISSTHVRKGATIGANSTILCGLCIGAYAMVAAGAVVTCNVLNHAVVGGNPARVLGSVCCCGRVISHTRPVACCSDADCIARRDALITEGYEIYEAVDGFYAVRRPKDGNT